MFCDPPFASWLAKFNGFAFGLLICSCLQQILLHCTLALSVLTQCTRKAHNSPHWHFLLSRYAATCYFLHKAKAAGKSLCRAVAHLHHRVYLLDEIVQLCGRVFLATRTSVRYEKHTLMYLREWLWRLPFALPRILAQWPFVNSCFRCHNTMCVWKREYMREYASRVRFAANADCVRELVAEHAERSAFANAFSFAFCLVSLSSLCFGMVVDLLALLLSLSMVLSLLRCCVALLLYVVDFESDGGCFITAARSVGWWAKNAIYEILFV